MTHGKIDYNDPRYPLAAKIVDHLINTGILSRNANIISATAQVMIILGKRETVVEEKTISKELLDLEYKKLAEKKAARTARRKEMNDVNERKRLALEREMTLERNFYTAAKGMMDISDFMALKQIAEEQITKKRKA